MVHDLSGKMHMTCTTYKAVDSKIIKWRKYLIQYWDVTGSFGIKILMRDYTNEGYYKRCGLNDTPGM